jgi:hypothetical protein
VPVFATEEDVYAHIGRLLESMCRDDQIGTRCQRADTIVQYRYEDPGATITVDLRRDSEPAVVLGRCALEPEVVMSMAADTAHHFFLGEVNVTVALARGQIRASGPVAKILKLVPLVKPFYPHYRALLQAEGRADLVPA